MPFELQITDTFSRELSNSPRKIRKKVVDSYRILRENPKGPHNNIQKLQKYKSTFRYKISNYRFVYRVEDKTITAIAIASRDKIYAKIGYDPKAGGPSSRIVADVDLHDLLEKTPTPKEIQTAQTDVANHEELAKFSESPKKKLPAQLSIQILRDLEIPQKEFGPLIDCNTEADLLNLSDSSEVTQTSLSKVLEELYPKPTEDSKDDAKRIIPSENSLNQLVEGERSLDSFLLALDEDQKPLTERFKSETPRGPWIVKGGPGSGKSTVALYCIKNILSENNQTLDMSDEPLKVLFVTYTKTLVAFSDYLLEALGVNKARQVVKVINKDRLVNDYLPKNWSRDPITKSNRTKVKSLGDAAIQECKSKDPSFAFTAYDLEFLQTEIEHVIIGNEIQSEEEYLAENRKGRGRPLFEKHRKQVWKFQLELRKRLEAEKLCYWQDRVVAAKSCVKPDYDYIFIDEAQDLSPLDVRFCVSLAKEKRNIFLTADRNQSIYRSGFSWPRVSETLNFRGRSTIFRKNYRTTCEIVEAVRPLLDGDGDLDHETLEDEPVKLGPQPQLKYVSSAEEELKELQIWLDSVRVAERIGFESAAILCPTNSVCEEIAESLPKKYNAKFFNKNSGSFNHPGVKVMTMHSSKGLQFPAVAVIGLKEGLMPKVAYGGEDPGEWNRKERRVFYVACTRAMNRLLVIASRDKPSSFVEKLDADDWL